MGKIGCKKCDKVFHNSSNLKRHMANVHKVVDKDSKFFSCELCEYKTLRSDGYKKHKLNVHQKEEKNWKRFKSNKKNGGKLEKFVCVICKLKNTCREEIVQHLKSNHNIVIDFEILKFNNFENFEEWKRKLEKTEFVQFARKYSFATKNDNTKVHYACFRNGFYASKAKSRQEKKLGSNKINGYCPAEIDVEINSDGQVKAFYQKTHVGHTNEVSRLRLSRVERQDLAKRLSLKMSFDDILDDVRSNELGKINMLSKKDLHNVTRDFHLFDQTVKHTNEGINVNEWVAEMQKYNGISIFYKKKGDKSEQFPDLLEDDSLLVIITEAQKEVLMQFGSQYVAMDSTFGLNSPNSLELTTLVVLDDLQQGFPGAFLFSNTVNYQILYAFLMTVNLAVKSPITPKVLMSGLLEEFYSAWYITMGPAEHRIYCPWHVDRAWRKDLVKINGGREKQVTTYKLLRTISEESDPNVFLRILRNAVEQMKEDPDTAEFGDFFEKEYAHKTGQWACCYHLYQGLTNKHLEKMHSVIKNYLKGKKIKILDIALPTIMKFLREKFIDRLLHQHSDTISSKLLLSNYRHEASLLLNTSIVSQVNEFTWNVHKSTNVNLQHFYQVTKVVRDTPCSCELQCSACHSCIHGYICTCYDSMIGYNMCKHIHLVIRSLNQEPVETLNIPDCDNDNNDWASDSYYSSKNIIRKFEAVWNGELENQSLIQVNNKLNMEKEKLLKDFETILSKINNMDGVNCLKKALKLSKTEIFKKESSM